MSTGKRLAKRSIVGTRVVAPTEGGLFIPGVIQGTKSWGQAGRETIYCVLFESGVGSKGSPSRGEYKGHQLIGPGFEPVTAARLTSGQRVYMTYNGREVSGLVTLHEPTRDQVFLTIDSIPHHHHHNKDSLLSSSFPIQVIRRLEEVRLMESRKSARLQELDTDYSRLACGAPGLGDSPPPATAQTSAPTSDGPHRRRTSSMSSSNSTASIDVPFITNGRKRRPSDSEDPVMNDCAAAMVLMSLSCSPKSPLFSPFAKYSQSWASSVSGSSLDSGLVSSSLTSRTTTPSPPAPPIRNNQENATGINIRPTSVPVQMDPTPAQPYDEGIEMDEDIGFGVDPETPLQPKKNVRRIVFQCTWPGCGLQHNNCQDMERHVRTVHLGRKDMATLDQEEEGGDHEEEFYYTEIEVDVEEGESCSGSSSGSGSHWPPSPCPSGGGADSPSESTDSTSTSSQSPIPSPGPSAAGFFASSSAPTWSHLDMVRPPHEDPEYQKALHRESGAGAGAACILSSPINIPGISFAHPYATSVPLNLSSPKAANHCNGNKYMKLSSNSKTCANNAGAGTTLLLSPISGGGKSSAASPSARSRGRGETRKCRKVYGMENRELWCTQCKWKKACSRFIE